MPYDGGSSAAGALGGALGAGGAAAGGAVVKGAAGAGTAGGAGALGREMGRSSFRIGCSSSLESARGSYSFCPLCVQQKVRF
jgi:hypothetical protein